MGLCTFADGRDEFRWKRCAATCLMSEISRVNAYLREKYSSRIWLHGHDVLVRDSSGTAQRGAYRVPVRHAFGACGESQ